MDGGMTGGRHTGIAARAYGALTAPLGLTRGCCLTFHRAAPSTRWDSLPNRDFYLDADFLHHLLGYLSRMGWAVVTMEEAVRRTRTGQGGRFVNFSVDDCYRDTAELVVPVFRCHGLPVTLFVTTGIPDGTLELWHAGLETILAEHDSVQHAGVTTPTRTAEEKRQAYAAINGAWDGDDAASLYHAFCAANGADPAALRARHAITWDMLEALRDDPCVEIGAHTISHPHLAALTDEDAAHEIAGARERLQERLGIACDHIAFPFGRRADCGPREFEASARAGYASAATTRKGLARAGQDVFSLPRNTLNGSHRRTMLVEAHLTGLTGLAARLLRSV